MIINKIKNWVYHLSVRVGITMLSLSLVVLIFGNNIIPCDEFVWSLGCILTNATTTMLVLTGAALGALIGINSQRHEDQKRKDNQPSKIVRIKCPKCDCLIEARVLTCKHCGSEFSFGSSSVIP